MRIVLSLVSVAAIVVAACSSEQAAPPANQAAGNQTGAVAGQARTVSNAADSIRARQSHLKEFGGALKGVNRQLGGSSPNMQEIQRHAARLREQAPLLAGWFPQGSGSEAGLRTRAKAEIWSDPEGFRRASQAFIAATEQFERAAQSGDAAAIRAGLRDVQGSCKGCHDRFRVPDEE